MSRYPSHKSTNSAHGAKCVIFLLSVLFVFSLFNFSPSLAQDLPESPSDTLSVPPDTSKSKASSLDSTVTYSAGRVEFTFDPRVTLLYGNAKVNYKTMELTAGKIEIHWDEDLLFAEPLPDTVKVKKSIIQPDSLLSDSLVINTVRVDSIGLTGQPKMKDGAQVIEGDRMTYDIKTRRGRVLEGKTEWEDGFYHGSTIKRIDARTYNIRSGYYTTCALDEPHYGFWSRDMKMIVKDKIIARPVVLQFGPVPVAILPFGVFPGRGGRHSGILVPTYGESANNGRYFTGLGYYYAPNDYWDARGSLDYYERYGILFRSDLDYALRYRLRGGLSGSYVNQNREGAAIRRWDLKVDHNQTLSPSSNLNVNAYFVSDNSYLRDLSRNTNERLRQTIRSDATLNKFWPETPYSASMNLHHEKDLATGNIDQSIPRVSLNRNQQPLIAPPEGSKPDDARWWNLIYWSYRGSGVNNSQTRFTTRPDSSEFKTTRDRSGVQHNLTLSSSTKPFGYFSFTPGVSYSESWFDEWLEYFQDSSGVIDTLKHKEFRARRTFSASTGLSTKLYGLFRPRVLGLEAIRHTLTPSFGFNYAPDFGEAKWGYYQRFEDRFGTERFYDRFAGNVFGGTPRKEQMSVSMSVDNFFEYKRKVGDKEEKGELFNFGASTNHNFKADSLKWGDLGTSLRIKPLLTATGAAVSGLDLNVSAGHSFYDQVEVAPGSWVTVNRGADAGLRLTGYDLTTSLKIQGGRDALEKGKADTTGAIEPEEDRFAAKVWKPSPLPWTAGIGLRYGESRPNPDQVVKNAWSSVNIELQLTPNWRLNSDLRIDLISKEIVSTGISLYRDLHCWEGRFTWSPVGLSSGFYLNIAIKSPHLQDVKVEKREGSGGFFGM